MGADSAGTAKSDKRVIISPGGQLNFISFTTLLTRDKQFLAQTYDVQYVASRRDLLRELKPSIASEVVLFADPDFGLVSTPMLAEANNRSSDPGSESIRGSEKRDIEDWSFGSLGGTQKERDELIKGGGWGQVKYRCMVLQLIFDLSPSSSSVSVTLQRPSTRCLSVGNIASQVGVSTATIAGLVPDSAKWPSSIPPAAFDRPGKSDHFEPEAERTRAYPTRTN